MSEPLVGAALFRTVMQAADHRCQCQGECGQPHRKGGGRCPHQHDGYTSKHGRRVRLIAAPADPLASAVAAASLPPEQLRAWCPDCHTTAARAAKRALPDTSTDQGCLFDL
ncbi:hypothetical protein [Streptomyces lasiicapitis]|uniref:HNH endonuclease n=1 Tax=Streptomyces lasiicapitis TaxID=1923961 RepID=A0ABQ2MQ80_9ACTN|nr:hypothetical protein [Streptomyces lasiicapitis]GGO55836.1 hypothetical protein GCM10012286_68890 [Streptomyces lasiicapitis]